MYVCTFVEYACTIHMRRLFYIHNIVYMYVLRINCVLYIHTHIHTKQTHTYIYIHTYTYQMRQIVMQEVGLRMRERLKQMVLDAQNSEFKPLAPRTIIRPSRTMSPTRVSITEPIMDVNPVSPGPKVCVYVCVCVYIHMCVCVILYYICVCI